MMTKDLMKKELIGLRIDVVDSKNRADIGISGKVIDETKNCIRMITEKGEKSLIKENITIEAEGSRIEGRLLAGRPEERIKKKSRDSR